MRGRAVTTCLHKELTSFIFVKTSTVVDVILDPDLFDDVLNGSVTLGVCSHAVGECLVVEEERVVDKNLDVAREDFPSDASLIFEWLAINHNNLLGSFGCRRSGVISKLELWLLRLCLRHIDADLLAANVCRVATISLDTATTACIRHDSSHTESSLPGRVRDPCDVDQAIINCSEWVNDHTSISVLSIVDHHESCVHARLVDWLIVDRKLIGIFNEAAAECLQVGRK